MAELLDPHVHRWLLEPNRPVDARGECACGAIRIFRGIEEASAVDHYRKKRTLISKPFDHQERVVNEVMSQFRQSFWEAM